MGSAPAQQLLPAEWPGGSILLSDKPTAIKAQLQQEGAHGSGDWRGYATGTYGTPTT